MCLGYTQQSGWLIHFSHLSRVTRGEQTSSEYKHNCVSLGQVASLKSKEEPHQRSFPSSGSKPRAVRKTHCYSLLCLKVLMVAPESRAPRIIEAWFSSSLTMRQPCAGNKHTECTEINLRRKRKPVGTRRCSKTSNTDSQHLL